MYLYILFIEDINDDDYNKIKSKYVSIYYYKKCQLNFHKKKTMYIKYKNYNIAWNKIGVVYVNVYIHLFMISVYIGKSHSYQRVL